MSKANIRPANKDDAAAIRELCHLHAAYEEQPFATSGLMAQPSASEMACYLFDDATDLHCLVVEEDGRLVGFTTFAPQHSTWRARPYLYVDCLFLIETARGRGLGRSLMERVGEEAGRLGCDQVQWQTPSQNTRAIRFYNRLSASSAVKTRFTWQIDGEESPISLQRPDTPYRPRPTRLAGIRECNGWRLKMYEITLDAGPIATSVSEAALAFFQENAAWPYEVSDRFGFTVLHSGHHAVWALLKLWTGDILRQFIYRAPVSKPTEFTTSPLPGFNECVWELEVTRHERDAWVRHIMSSPRKPDFERYLNDSLAIAQPPASRGAS